MMAERRRRTPVVRPLLRIAARDALRAKGRTALIVAMIALPVFGVSFIDVLLRTSQQSPFERAERTLGAADARIEPSWDPGPVRQLPTEPWTYPVDGDGSGAGTHEPVDPTTVLPAGTRWVTDNLARLRLSTPDQGITLADVRELDYTDPIADGIVTQVDGRAPRNTSEAVVTPGLLDALGLGLGDELTVVSVNAPLTVVGTFRDLDVRTGSNALVALPGTVLDRIDSNELEYAGAPAYLVDTPEPVTWDEVVSRYNAAGFGVLSRAVVSDPPPDSAVPLLADGGYREGGIDFAVIAAVALLVGLAMLEVALLAGAAFAVGARRQSRALGLLAATGAESKHVRRVLLGQGLLLGAVGGVVGSVAGVAGGSVTAYSLDRWFGESLGPVDLRPLELAAIAALGVVTGLLAAALPARNAGRQDVVAALRGRRGVTRTARRWPVIGVVAALSGAAVSLGGGAIALASGPDGPQGSRATLAISAILVGAVVTQLGLIVATPAVLGGVGRLARFLPLGPRLAVRDAARHRGRSAPAVAAVLAAVAGSVAVSVYVSALSDHDREAYQPSQPYGAAVVHTSEVSEAQVVAAVSQVAPPSSALEVKTLDDPGCTIVCSRANIAVQRLNQPDGNYSSQFSGPAVGTYEDFVALTGVESEAALATLADGGAVVFSAAELVDGVATLEVSISDGTSEEPAVRRVELPATYVPLPDGRFIEAFLSPRAAELSGLEAVTDGMLLRYDELPSVGDEQKVRDELEKIGVSSWFEVERGYRDGYGPGLLALLIGSTVITLGAAGVATGLAQADARPDHATLAAVGAPARLRRTLSAAQAATVAGLGSVLGTLSGLVPVVAYLYADPEIDVVVPWVNVAVIVVVVPVLGAASAWLLTRARLPLERRLAA